MPYLLVIMLGIVILVQPMKVLMFGWEFPPHNSGGLGVACYGLTRGLHNQGFDIAFVMPKRLEVGAPWVDMVFADLPKVKVRVINSPIQPYNSNGGSYIVADAQGRAVYGGSLMEEVLRYAADGERIALEERFDVIYAHDWLSFGAGVEAKKATGKPLIVQVHATEFDRGGGTGVNQDVYEIERMGMHAADVVIAVSELTKNIIVEKYGVSPDKVRVVYNGIDDATAPQGNGILPRLRKLKTGGTKIVLFLGRITLQKGPDYFVKVAKRVTAKNPKVLFVMSGAGDMEQQMMAMSASMGLSDKMLFTGFVSGHERHEAYSAADLFIMPSVSEPFGITALEAMRLGVPVIVSKQSGVAEAVNHVLKVDFWDTEETANKILGVLMHPGITASMAVNAVREADTMTWEKAAQKVDNIVRELVPAV